jgi:hypothetical protein
MIFAKRYTQDTATSIKIKWSCLFIVLETGYYTLPYYYEMDKRFANLNFFNSAFHQGSCEQSSYFLC